MIRFQISAQNSIDERNGESLHMYFHAMSVDKMISHLIVIRYVFLRIFLASNLENILPLSVLLTAIEIPCRLNHTCLEIEFVYISGSMSDPVNVEIHSLHLSSRQIFWTFIWSAKKTAYKARIGDVVENDTVQKYRYRYFCVHCTGTVPFYCRVQYGKGYI